MAGFLTIALFLSAGLLFNSCKDEDNFVDDNQLNANLIGTWTSNNGDWGIDGYKITADHLTYGNGATVANISNAGTIKYVSNFSSTAGVIIIQYDSNHKASYSDYSKTPPTPLPLKGDFIGVYYKNLKPGVSVQMGGAYIDGGAEEATLDAAKAAFTKGREGTYMAMYGTYLK